MIEINKRYSFSTIAPITLGETYVNVKAVAELSFNMAIKYRDIISVHKAIENEQNIPLTDYKQLKYYLFETDSGESIIIANEWIITNSIVEVDKIKLLLEIEDISSDQVLLIKNALLSLGFNKLKLNMENVQ